MKDSREALKREIQKLTNEGIGLLGAVAEFVQAKGNEADRPDTLSLYQNWYTMALPVVRQLLPERYAEFQEQYRIEKRKDAALSVNTYTIADYLMGITVKNQYKEEVFSSSGMFLMRFQHQITMLQSALERVDSILSDIRSLLQAEMFDHELEASEELLRKNHLRAAGALAGVALESHFAEVSRSRLLKTKANPAISDYNDLFKNSGIYDVPDWRFVQRLGDIRNYCVHSKDRDPTKAEVQELIEGVRKCLKTIF